MANDLSLDLNILSNPTDSSLSANDYVVDSGYTEGDNAIGVTGRVVVSSTAAIKTFSAAVSANADDDDVLALSNYGQLVARAFRISYSYDADTSTFTFTPPTTGGVHPGVVSVLFREILFSNSGTTPMDNTREITFSVSDGANTSSAVSYVAVTDTNDAPVLTFPGTLSAIDEDNTFSFAALEVSDTDGDIVKVTIDASIDSAAAGTFSITLPTGVTEVSNTAGQIVLQGAPTALTTAFDALSYSAGSNVNGDVAFTIAAVEMTTSDGGSIDVPLSATNKTATLTITAVNDAPVTDATATLTLTSAEDGSGTAASVASVFGAAMSDVDGDTPGVAITGVTIATIEGVPIGTLQYSTDAGANWADVSLDAGKALLLSTSAELRFVPGIEDFNTTENPALAPSISFRAWDGSTGSEGTQVAIASTGSSSAFSAVEGTAEVVVTPVNDAPVIDLDSGAGQDGTAFAKTIVEIPGLGTAGYVVPSPLFDSGSDVPTISDVDSTNVTKIEIQITTDGSTAVDGETETLALGIDGFDFAPLLVDGSGAKSTWDAATATLVIEAADTNTSGVLDRAQAELLIHSVYYANSSQNPTDFDNQTTRDIVFTITDSDANGSNTQTATATSTVTIMPFDDAPTLTTPDAALEITSAETASLAGLSVSDVDSLTATVRVTIDAGPAGSRAAQFSIDDAYTKPAEITFDNSGDELVISVDTEHADFDAATNYVNAINTLLDNVVYTPNLAAEFASLGAGTVVNITASVVGDYTDPYSVVDNATGSFSIKVTPSLTTSNVQPASPSFNEDTDSGVITVKPAEGFADLEFTSVTDGKLYLANSDGSQGAEISLNTRYDLDHASTGGDNDSVRVIFVPNADYNDANGGTAEFTVRSAIGDGDTAPRGADATFTPTVTQVNDAPVLSFNGSETFPTTPLILNEDGSVVFSSANSQAITFADIDDGEGAQEPTVTLSVSNGTLTLGSTSNVTPTGNGTGTLTVTGPIAAINAALNGLTYAPTANFNGSDSISVSVNDNGLGGGAGLSDSDTVSLTITAVNDKPVVTLGAQTGAQEDAAFTLTGLDVSDIDSAASAITVTLSVDEGTLSATGTADVTVTGDSTAELVLTGTAANLSTFLGTNPVSFSAGANFNGDVTLTMKAEDGGASGSGGELSDTKTTTISVAAVNDAPTVVSGQEAQTLAAIDEDTAAPTGATVSSLFGVAFQDTTDDQTANTNGGSANTFGGVIITNVPDTTGKGIWEANKGSGWAALSLGTDAGIFLSSSAELRFVPDANWNGTVPSLSALLVESGHGYTDGQVFATLPNTAGTSAVSSGTVTVGSTVNAVNDPVTITPETDGLTLAEDASETALGVSFSLSDVDAALDATGQVKATVSVAGVAADGTTPALSLSGVTGIVANVATITGTLSEVQTALNGLKVTPAADFNGTATVNVSVTDDNGTTVATGSGAATSDSSAVTVTITPVNDAPVVKSGAESVTLTAVSEDATDPAGASLSSLVGASLDDTADGADAASLFGVFVSGNTATSSQGVWQYQSGASWVDIGTVSAASPLYLTADTNVRFVPATDYSGTPGALSVHLIEGATVPTQTDLTAGGATGGDTAVSSATVSIGTSVTPVADAPNLSDTADLNTNEDTAVSFAIATSLADTDGSETLSVKITGAPSGAVISDGTNSATSDGTTAIDVSSFDRDSLTVTPPSNSGDNFTLTVTSTATDGTDTASSTDTIAVTVTPVADKAALNVSSAAISANEDAQASTSGSISLVDTDGSEAIVEVRFSPVGDPTTYPLPAAYFDGTKLDNGSTFTIGVTDVSDQAATAEATVTYDGTTVVISFDATDAVKSVSTDKFSIGFAAEDASGNFTVAVTAVTQEGSDEANQATTDAVNVGVTINAVADTPDLGVSSTAVSGDEDAWISLGTIIAVSVDNDSSETLVVELSGLPEGASLRDGGGNTAIAGANGKVVVSDWNLGAIEVKPVANVADDFTVTVTATVTEASNSDQATDSKTVAVTVNPVADAPSVNVANTSISADEGSTATTSGSVALVDVDGSEAIVAVRFEPVTAGDTAPAPAAYYDGTQLTNNSTISLPVTAMDGTSKTVTGTVSVVGTTVVVSFDASDAVKAIDSDKFSIGFSDENANGSFNVKVSAVTQEGSDATNQAETTPVVVNVTINAVNDGPAATGPATVSVNEDATLSFTGDNELSVSDIDVSESAGNVTVRLSVANGTLSVTPAAGLDATDAEHDVDGSDGTLVFTGTVAAVNSTLASLSYTGDQDFNTENGGNTETLSFDVEDNGATGSGGELTDSSDVAITVNAVNDAPVLVAPDGGVAATEDTEFAFTGANAISVSDVDVSEDAAALTVALSVNNGTLGINTTGVTLDSGAADSAAITISGTAAALNTALATLTYTGDENFNDTRGSESLSITVSDAGSFGTGGTLSDTATVAITVAAVNDAPVAAADTASTDENTSTTVNVLANDSDDDTGDTPADVISVTSVTQPDNGGSVTLAEGVVSFDPNGDFEALDDGESDTTSFTYTISDGDVSKTETVTVTVTGVNDAPIVATNAGITLDEGGTATIGKAALESTDVDIETLTYTVTTLPTNGALKVDGVEVALNGTFTQADIDANKVTYVHDGGETTSDSIGFSMSDGTETVSGQSIAITVNSVNDAPTSTAPSTISVNEDETFSFIGTNELSVSDSDSATNDVTVTLEVQNGVLNVGAAEAANVTFDGADINGTGKLVFSGTVAQVNAALSTLTYTGNENFNTKTGGLTESLVFDVTDNGNSGTGGALSASQKTVAITVTPVNDDPSVTGSLDTASFSEAIGTKSGQAVFLASSGAFTVSDVELSDTPAETLNGAVLKVALSGDVQNSDVLEVVDRGLVTVSGSTVSYAGTAVASTSGGSGTTALSVAFNADASAEAVAAVLEAVQFDNQSATPAGLDHSATSRSVSVDFTDGDGGTATTVTGSITVSPVNDAPTATNAVVNYTAGVEDTYDASTDSYTVRAFLADKAEQVVSDIDTDNVDAGIAITSVDSLNGVFKYKLSASDAFTAITGVSEDNALVLGPDAIITYEPTTDDFNTEHAGFGAPDGISYKVWDQSPGTSTISQGDFVDTRKGGVAFDDGEGPFSDATYSVDALITAVNDAPEWTAPAAEQTLDEDTSLTFNAANGNLLSIADVDSDEDGGTGLLTVTVGATRGNVGVTASGAASVTGNNSGSVTIEGSLADVNATLDGLVYTAIADQNGQDSLVLSVTDNGNSSAGSTNPLTDTATVSIAISAINDAPVVAAGESVRTLAAIKEDALLDPLYDAPGASVSNLVGSAFGDAADAISGGSSASQLAGIAITANAASAATEGVWRYKLATDADWGTGDTNLVPTNVSDASAFVLPADAELRFEPVVNFNSDSVDASTYGLTAYMIEDSAGSVTAGASLDLTVANATGGTTAVSAATISIENVVEGVNDIFRFEVSDPTVAVDATNIVTNHTAVPGMTDAAVDGVLSTGLGDYVDMEFFDFGTATDGITFDIDMFKGLVQTDPTKFADKDADGNPVHFAGFQGRGVNGAVDSTLVNVISFGNTNPNIALAAEIQNFSTFGFGGNNEALITVAINVSQTWDDGSLQAAVIYDPNRQNAEGNAVILARLTGFTEDDMALFTTDDFALFS